MRREKQRRMSRRGFTLMELLVVMAILVLLAGFVVPKIIGVLGSSKKDMTRTQIRALEEALRRYNFNMDVFPSEEQGGLEALVKSPTGEDEKKTSRWEGPYFEKGKLPKDPWGNDYQYAYEIKQDRFPKIWSFGPDEEDNTEDDICNWEQEGADGEGGLEDELDTDLLDEGPARDRIPREPAMD